MTRSQQPALAFFAIGMIGLGVLALIYGDFAMGWQPVAEWVPGRTALAYVSGVIMLLGGIGLLFARTAGWSAAILFPYLAVWVLLKVPAVLTSPQVEVVWLGFGEIAVLFMGGWVLFAKLAEPRDGSWLKFASSQQTIRALQLFFGLCLIPIGLSHLVYVKATTDFVPPWLPFRVGWVYLSGVGQIACGLGLLLSILPRFAAFTEAAMIGSFTVLVWIPRILAGPKERLPWTAFFISWAIGSGAWVVAQSFRPSKTNLKAQSPQREAAEFAEAKS